MLLRLLRLFVFAAAPVILVASPARRVAEKVPYAGDAKPGTIVIQSEERRLDPITGKDQARKYPVGKLRLSGKARFGTTRIAGKHIKPAWKPPVSLRGKRSPDFYIEFGSPKNPMGAAALVLADSELAIHGTNNPGSIGGFVSAGCIRMHNKDIMDLYGRVQCRYAGRVCKVNRLRNPGGAECNGEVDCLTCRGRAAGPKILMSCG